MVVGAYVSIIVFVFDVNDELSALGALADGDRVDLDDIYLPIDDLLRHIEAVHISDENASVLFEAVPVVLGDHARQVDLLLGGKDRPDERVVGQVQDISLL